jgi:hypothetical protein
VTELRRDRRLVRDLLHAVAVAEKACAAAVAEGDWRGAERWAGFVFGLVELVTQEPADA